MGQSLEKHRHCLISKPSRRHNLTARPWLSCATSDSLNTRGVLRMLLQESRLLAPLRLRFGFAARAPGHCDAAMRRITAGN